MTGEAPQKRLALLDRDGTIIIDKVYLNDPDGVEFAPGALDGLRLLRDSGFVLVLITNQSGVARGYFGWDAVERVHQRLEAKLAAEGIRLEATYVCPHGPNDGCECRKPAPGLALSALRDFGFRPEEAVLIGDSDADMGAAAAAGVQGLRVASAGEAASGAADSFLRAAERACGLTAARERMP
jgi:D-glycero-D-manno-heptose 1,7-bisphosphate phosphatase